MVNQGHFFVKYKFSLKNRTEKLLRVNYPFDLAYFLFLPARLGFSWNVTKRVTKQKVKP